MTKTNTRSRIVSILLVLMMLLTMVPITGVTASAADDTSYTQAEIRNYYTFATYLRSFDSRDLKLMEDIDYMVGINDLSIDVIRNQKLDLNGHKITINASRRTGFENLLCIRRGEFTLYDSKGGGELAVAFPNDNKAYSIIMMSSEKEDEPSKFTMNGGTLTKLRPNMTYSYGASGCIGDDYFNKPENGKRPQITINDGTINCPYEWDRSQSLLDFEVEVMPLALQLLYSNLTINGGTFNGIVWTDKLTPGKGETEPRVVLNGGVFNSPFVVDGMSRNATQIVIDGARFNDGFHVDKGDRINTAVGTVPVLLLKSGVFTSPDKNPKLDIYNVTAESYGNGVNSDATARAKLKMILHAMKCFPNSAIKVNGKFYTSENIESLVGKNNDDFYLKLNSSTPIEVIRDAWGVMESVTLDGNPIDYFKDWKGTVERMDNSTAHTLKFEWKPLASELVNAGYSYRTKCEHYISGSAAVQQTDTIAADKTSHTVTIPVGADPKVYSYDLQLNLDKNGSSVGIMANQHIVKLVVSEAPVVEPDPTIDGTVYYTSGIVFGHPISIAASVTPAEATKSYQWQRSTDGGSIWTNIEGATSGRYTPVTADMGENVRIRVKVTAEGYLGEIVSAAVKVSKAANNNYPEVIKLEAVKNGAGNYTGFKITNFDSDCEYVYSTTDTPNWGANQISSASVTGLTSDTTYYVFARFKETNIHTAGSIVSKNSIRLYEYVPLDRVLLEGYDSGNTIYIKKGKSVTLKVSADPSNANSWKEITFKDSSLGTSNIAISNGTINASTGTATPFPNRHTITITGVSTGSATLDASYSGPTQPYYGRWNVVVYDDSTVANALRLENVYAYEDITLSVNDEAQLPTKLPKLLPANSGYHLEWRILKRGTYGATYVTENDNIKLEDGKIKPKAAHAASEKAQLELVAVKDGSTEYKTLPKTSLFYVTVTETPVIELTGITVAPTKVNLELNKTFQLSAVKEPVNAAGSLTWTSSNTGVATVDSTGKVTAKAQGTAIITVSCGDKKATCTVTVDHQHDYSGQPYLYLDPGNHYQECKAGDDYNIQAHEFTPWTDNGNGTHSRYCTVCKMTDGSTYTETALSPGYTVYGAATSFGSQTDDVTIQLIESGASEAAYEAVVHGNTASYSIAGVAPGTYTMKVMKKNHVMREYTVTVSAENVTQDVKICLLGDVNMDGAVTMQDVLLYQKHLAKIATFSSEEQKKIADLNDDGFNNLQDVLLIQKIIAKIAI
ncbi:MAG: Ig-like domain-containing protein [Acutalibacteraceae bacterium]